MRRRLAALCAAALVVAVAAPLATAAPLFGRTRGLPAPVHDALARARVPLGAVAAVVEPAEGGAALVAHRERAAMNPASVMKLVTSYAALGLLGPAFTFRTDVLLDGELKDGVLAGNLVLRGGGDPELTYERVWQIAHQLRARGLSAIRGDVVVDRGYFAPAADDAARFDSEPRRAYNVPPDALLVNFGAIEFTFVPGADGVSVVGEPDLPGVRISAGIRAVPGPCGAWRHGLAYEVHDAGLGASVEFSGTYPAECGERTWPLAVLAPPRMLEAVFRWAWSEAGGTLTGRVRDGATPDGARLFLRHRSEPLANLLRDMNKFSNNVMARDIFLALSAELADGPGTAAESARIVREWLAGRGIDASGLVLENGSGLSRDERVSAATLAALLRSAWASGLMPELASSLPIFAVDGTFEDRPESDAAGRAHVKGGTLTGVQSIAGYVLDRAGRRWIVVMMVNDPQANAAESAFDALLEWVAARGAPRPGRARSG
ncbi:MAG TPA: D-alanyl-D-alanine carboxypeptidase/D-alanyl-D-alanine-endopeptidase [Usitatibacter sp.]|nr:D-alanyl-D-alanine carboxypeptidase/D-alanyl-D-alanine-endopeptidase [Usitatibacter sp.]